MKILIVDDQFGPREAIRMVLKDKYSVVTAAGTVEAFKYMAGNSFNVVLLDIKMPKIDGITALREIKKKYPETEVILLSAYATPETIQKALKFGAFGYLTKPFNKNELLDIVEQAINKQGST